MKEVPVIDVRITDLKEPCQEGYNMLEELRHEADAPIVKAKIFNKEVIVTYGLSVTRIFYDPRNFKRKGAVLRLVLKAPFGQDGVQTLDGAAHRHQKNTFMDLMTPERMEGYHRILDKNLTQAPETQYGQFELFDLGKMVFFTSIHEWAGINLSLLSKGEVRKLTEYQIFMISGASTPPAGHVKSAESRRKSEKWAQDLIEEARRNPVTGKENVTLYTSANTTGLDGQPLPLGIVAVKLLDIIHPTVTLTAQATLIGYALFSRSDPYQQLGNDFSTLQDPFVQEVRRCYPSSPTLPVTSLKEVRADGCRIPEDSWVILGLYGTDHNERMAETPDSFVIRRRLGKAGDISHKEEHGMITQDGGDFRQVHHYAGGWITLHNLRAFSGQLVSKFEFFAPEQDWTIPFNQFPTCLNSRALLYRN